MAAPVESFRADPTADASLPPTRVLDLIYDDGLAWPS
ncbi:hypothetical protein M271_00655 [Streptomyces rapamycinicus NRRL 5491]|uniref:Uncharacterized protein n=1 Tax=Streptomyces rapamycinicus TaxID=1226757 RepID=A0ABR6LA28_9ACTN|nr:hypothetical protein M271_00655 [Streptomyces rapamycinicus NRRL 5491]MBB4779181.1 hypothetical protein [Streptomyces rapamycinicus]